MGTGHLSHTAINSSGMTQLPQTDTFAAQWERVRAKLALELQRRGHYAPEYADEILHLAIVGATARGDGKVTIQDLRSAAGIHAAVRRTRLLRQAESADKAKSSHFSTPPASPILLPVTLMPRPPLAEANGLNGRPSPVGVIDSPPTRKRSADLEPAPSKAAKTAAPWAATRISATPVQAEASSAVNPAAQLDGLSLLCTVSRLVPRAGTN